MIILFKIIILTLFFSNLYAEEFSLKWSITVKVLDKIEFIEGQLKKALEDVEKLKDANREMKYNGNGSYPQ